MQQRKIKIAILSISTLLMSANLIPGILGEIARHYAKEQMSVTQTVLTLPFLVATVFALATGPLSTKISKKALVLFALCCLLASSLLAFFVGRTDIKVLLASSVLLGINQGMLVTLSMSLIADFFEGYECNALMGLSSAFVNFGGMLVTFVAALLSGIAWYFAYLAPLMAVIPFFIVILFLPTDTPAKMAAGGADEKGKMNGTVFLNVLTVFLYGVFMFVFQTNFAIFLKINQLGDVTVAGMVNTVFVATGGVTGIVYGRLSKVSKGFILPVGLAVTVVGLLQLFFFGDLVSVYITAMCVGFGLTSVMPTALFNASSAVKPSLSAMAIALISCAINVGIFISPIAVSLLSKFIGNRDVRTNFIIGAIGLTVVAGLYILGNARITKLAKIATTSS